MVLLSALSLAGVLAIRQSPSTIEPYLFRWRVPLAVVVSSLMFGALHHQGENTFGSWFVVGTTTTIGMVLAVIRYRTGRLGMAVCTHVLFNASGVALALWF